MTGQVNDEGYAGRPHPALAPYVNRIVGYRIAGMSPGVHIGMPSSFLTLIVTLDDPVVVQAPGGPVATFAAMVGGLHDRPVAIHHEGHQHGIQLDLTAAGARALFGRPAGELTQELVNLSDLLDPADRGLADQAADQPTWPAKVAVVERALLRRLDPAVVARPELGQAWDQIRRSRGTVPVWAVAAEVGWSARHLAEQFRAEYGFGVKTAARIVRFDRSRSLVSARRPLAEVAALCGYADQAHLNRDWRQFAGTSPGRWEQVDQLAFFQDGEAQVG